MENSALIKEIVDIDLFSRLCGLFPDVCFDEKWLIVPDGDGKAKWGSLYAADVAGLMDGTDDIRELHALALFVWLHDFNDNKFIGRLVGMVSERLDVIFEAAIYNSCYSAGELKDILRGTLRNTRRDSCLEYLIALSALGSSISVEGKSAMSVLAFGLLKEVDIDGNPGIFARCVQIAEELGSVCKPQLQALLGLAKNVPKENGRDFPMLAYWGFDLLGQLKISYYLQQCYYGSGLIYSSNKKKEQLEHSLLGCLVKLQRDWTVQEREIVDRLAKRHPGMEVTQWKFAFDGCKLDLLHREDIGLLAGLDIPRLVRCSCNGLSSTQLLSAWETNRDLFNKALDSQGDDGHKVFCMLKGAGCSGMDGYREHYLKFLSKWETRESWDFIQENGSVNEVMSGFVSNGTRDYLSPEENEELIGIYRDWLEVWQPHRLQGIFGEEADSEKVLLRWYTQEEIDATRSLTEGIVDVPVRALVMQNPELKGFFTESEWFGSDELSEMCFFLIGEDFLVPTVEYLDILLDECSGGVAALLLKFRVNEEDYVKVSDIIPYLDVDRCRENLPWILNLDFERDLPGLSDIDWQWMRKGDLDFLEEFGCMFPLEERRNRARLRNLKDRSGEYFGDVADWVNAGVPLVYFEGLDSFDGLEIRMFGKYSELIDGRVPIPFIMYCKENAPDILDQMVGLHLSGGLQDLLSGEGSRVLFNSSFYEKYDFTGTNLKKLLPQLEPFIGRLRSLVSYRGRLTEGNLPDLIDRSVSYCNLCYSLGRGLSELEVVEKNAGEVYSWDTLEFRLSRHSLYGWRDLLLDGSLDRVMGTEDNIPPAGGGMTLGDAELVKLFSYPYRWGLGTIGYSGFIIENKALGAVGNFPQYWARKDYRVRHILEDFSVEDVLWGQLAMLWYHQSYSEIVAMVYDCAWSGGLAQSLVVKTFYSWLCGSFVCHGLEDYYGELDPVFSELQGKYQFDFLTASECVLKMQAKNKDMGIERAAALLLNFLDGTWLLVGEGIYCVRRDRDGVGVRLFSGADVLPEGVRRVSDGFIHGITVAPFQINQLEEVC